MNAAASASKLQRVRCALDRELHGITALPNQQRCSVLVQAALLQRDDARAAHPAPLHHDLRFCSPRVHDTPLYCERRQLHRNPGSDALCTIAPQDAPRAARAAPREAPTRCAASDACRLKVCASAARVGCAAASAQGLHRRPVKLHQYTASCARCTDAMRAALAALLLRKRRALHDQPRAAPLLGERRELYRALARVKSCTAAPRAAGAAQLQRERRALHHYTGAARAAPGQHERRARPCCTTSRGPRAYCALHHCIASGADPQSVALGQLEGRRGHHGLRIGRSLAAFNLHRCRCSRCTCKARSGEASRAAMPCYAGIVGCLGVLAVAPLAFAVAPLCGSATPSPCA